MAVLGISFSSKFKNLVFSNRYTTLRSEHGTKFT